MTKSKKIRLEKGLVISFDYDPQTSTIEAKLSSKVNQVKLCSHTIAECFCCGKVEIVEKQRVRHLCAECAKEFMVDKKVKKEKESNYVLGKHEKGRKSVAYFANTYKPSIKIVDCVKYQNLMSVKISKDTITMIVDLILKGINTSQQIASYIGDCNIETVYSFDLSELRSIKTVNKRISVPIWNKDEEPTEGRFKKYKLKVDEAEDVYFKPFHILEIDHYGSIFGIYFPCYELSLFEKLTGLAAQDQQ